MNIHKPVLLQESIEGLSLKKGAVVVDATLGGGGHSIEILKKIGKEGKLVAIDLDENALERFKIQISKSQFPNKSKIPNPEVYWKSEAGNVVLAKDNFSSLKNILGGQGIKSVDGVLVDLGYSSLQLEDEKYGLSFLKDAPLDMRLDRNSELTAEKIINGYSRHELERILKEYGEEKFYKNIARKIIEHRKIKPIRGTAELVEIIKQSVPKKFRYRKDPCLPAGRHPATKTFQALRIEVNKELVNLEKFIPQAIEILNSGGRLAVISFHSLEDRIVKNMFRENARGCICPPDFPRCVCDKKPEVRIVTKKPVSPSIEEIANNPRSRSAKLRICEKI